MRIRNAAGLGELPAFLGDRQRPEAHLTPQQRQAAERAESLARLPGQEPIRADFALLVCATIAGSKQFLAQNRLRRYLLLQNNTGASVTMGFGSAASADSFLVPAGSVAEWTITVPTNSISVWAAAGGGKFVLIEG